MSKNSINFNSFFEKVYGDRWPTLQLQLNIQNKTPRKNKYSTGQFSINPEKEIPRGNEGLLHFYPMDPASIYVAEALDVRPEHKVLDMCAAPGGKCLILAEALGPSGELIANELSASRRERLKKVIQQYLPRDVRDHVWLTGKDGVKFSRTHQRYFDRILLDVPCSAEAHMNEAERLDWTVNRSRGLAQRQHALLMSAWQALKPGGKIVYSTCSISPYENDGVMEYFTHKLQKRNEKFKIRRDFNFPGAETTAYGIQFLPDRSGFGPIYFSAIESFEQ